MGISASLKKIWNTFKYPSNIDQLLINQGQLLSIHHAKRQKIAHLAEVEWRVFSQCGDDGIIDWLVSRLPNLPKTFVEFGVENYRESNTRFLLQYRNWRGLVMDGSQKHIDDIQGQKVSWRYWLDAKRAFITRENINDLLASAGFGGPIGLLSVDIDGNDYWVWERIEVADPQIVITEINAVFGDLQAISVPYDPGFVRSQAHYSHIYFGASLQAFIHLGKQKGYTFLGTNSTGVNAYFIKNNLAQGVLDGLEEIKSFPSLFSEERDPKGNLIKSRGKLRCKSIEDMPVITVLNNECVKIKDLGALYSESWNV